MPSVFRGIWQALAPFCLFFACAFAPAGCTCGPEGQSLLGRYIPCRPNHDRRAIAPKLGAKTIVPGTIPASSAVTDTGDAAISMPLVVPRGRAGVEPKLSVSYNSGAGDGILGVGFGLSGASSIVRCPKTMTMDGEIEGVHYADSDALCLDGKRLVSVALNEYRTFPDTQVKIVGNHASGFDAYLPNGWVIEYGKTSGTRPLARGGAARAWLAGETRDARGNAMEYGYCFAEADGFTAEYALTEIAYTKFEGVPATRRVSLVYGAKDDVRRVFSADMEFQNALRLDEIQMHVGDELVRRYEFAYEQGDTTARTRLVSAQECGADGACKPPTRFQYGPSTRGFEEVKTSLSAPTSRLSSPMLADFDGNGLDDLLAPDTSPILSTPDNPITEWRLARNQGNGFAPVKVAFTQPWSVVLDPTGPADPSQIQPELGTAFDYNQDGRADVLLHDVHGSKNNHIVLLSKADGTFEELDTGIKRPFPLGPAPKGLRGPGGSVHLADLDGDGVGDLVQCEDHSESPEGNPSQPAWTLHLWRPGGFEPNGTSIELLAGFSCATEMRTVDLNRNGVVDLVVPGMLNFGGTQGLQATTYSALERHTDGTWSAWDTKLDIPPSPGRVIFADVNGDGLPDAVTSGFDRLYTWTNTGKIFAEKPANSLKWDGLWAQDTYFHFAAPLDFDGDGRTDLLIPMANAPELPKWYILRAASENSEFTFEQIDAKITFETVLGEAVTLADPRGPRIGDVNGDGAPDVVLFIGNELLVFQNKASDPDLLVSFSDGLNEHEPEESGFIPNVSISYGHLIDGEGDSALYRSHADPTNECAYPRRCAVGPRRVVREYAMSDGQGGMRRFGLRYRDGRYDRRGHGFLGFGQRIVTGLDTNAGTATFYDNMTLVSVERDVYPFSGQAREQWRWAPALAHEPKQNRVELAFSDSTIDVVPTNDGRSYFTLPTKRHVRRMQGTFSGVNTLETWVGNVAANENATMLRDTTAQVIEYDIFGNVLEVDVSTVGVDLTQHTKRTVKNDVDRWILGQVDWQSECSAAAGLSRCRIFDPTTNQFGEVESESTSSDENILDTKLDVVYERDNFGNITSVTADDAFGHHRKSSTIYDGEGVFPVKQVNAIEHETKLEYDARFGVLAKETDPNLLITEWAYDGFGREKLERRPDGSQTTTTRTREKVGDSWRMKQRTTTTGGEDDETIFDGLGRPIRSFSHGPNPDGKAARVMQVLEYDRISGQVAKRSVPSAENTAEVLFDVFEFDALGREIRHTTPWNAVTTTSYDGFLVDSADLSTSLHTVTELDELGRPVVITDAKTGKTRYAYGPFGALYTATDPGDEVTKWTRDAFGRPRRIDDPDRGATLLVHDGFGELLASTDALGRVITFGIDALGRVETRTDQFGAQVLATTWTWDTAPNGIGRLHKLTSPDALKTFSYTKRGQIEGMTLTVGSDSFAARQSYDEFGRLKSVDYPEPLGAEPFGVMYEFDEHGVIIAVRDTATNEAFWRLAEVDQAGRYRKEVFGNDAQTTRRYFNDKQALESISTTLGPTSIQNLAYDWDSRLNLKSRSDTRQGKTERFRHDELDRITCAYFGAVENAGAPCVTSYAYAIDGNLTNKSDVGNLLYADNAHPHAVTQAKNEKFGYDAVGNQITRPGGVSVTYTPFDLPKTITQPGKAISFGYDGDEQRVRKTTPTTEALYFGGIFEQVTNSAGVVLEHRYYVHSPERAIAIVTRGGMNASTRFLHVDHLGSIDAITKEDGSLEERRSYDAFGARRNPEWGGPAGSFTSQTTRGFTGHEDEEDLGLVNMKGRIYDPKIGRFTTTDPVIADIWDGQSLNRYAYVLNRPLLLVDPTGFSGVVHQPGYPDVPLPDDHIEPSDEFRAEQEARRGAQGADQAEPRSVGGAAPTVDVGTTGNGASAMPQETTPLESKPDVWDGILEGVIDFGSRANEMIPGSPANLTAQVRTMVDIAEAYGNGDVIDAINVVNPLMGAATLGVAIDEEDWYTAGRAAVGVGVAIISVVVARKVGGGGKTTRGPPKATGGPRGTQNPAVAAAARKGQEAHVAREYPPGFEKEVHLPSKKRMDAYNETTKEVRELKPNNARAIKKGQQQVDAYCRECDRVYGPGHTGKVDTYD